MAKPEEKSVDVPQRVEVHYHSEAKDQREAEARHLAYQSTAATKALLDKSPKVHVRLPLGEDKTPVSVNINGYHYTIKRGVPVDVPKQVYDTLVEAGYVDGVERSMHTHEVRASMGLESVGDPDALPQPLA